MQNKYEILQPETTYHIYNRANGSEKLFRSDENYRYFLRQYQQYIEPIAETFCYCLMPNHFHFLIRIRSQKELEEFYKAKANLQVNADLQGFKNLADLADLQGFKNLEGLITKQFSNFFNAYAKAFNKQHKRKGSLFMHTFKRKRVTEKTYLLKLVHYIHYNPVESGLCVKPRY
jgi:putative transposase